MLKKVLWAKIREKSQFHIKTLTTVAKITGEVNMEIVHIWSLTLLLDFKTTAYIHIYMCVDGHKMEIFVIYMK